MFGSGGSCARRLRELPKLDVGATLYPRPAFDRERLLEIRFRVGAAERRPRGTALIPPQGVFPEHPLTRVAREACHAVAQKPLGIGGPACAQARRPAFEPHQTVPGKAL